MDANKLPLYQFLEGARKCFIIPVYQRDYAWTKTNCLKLWNDLIDLNKNSRNNHFFGNLVTIGEGFEEYIVIDGQQRITTVSLLLKALHDYLEDKEIIEEEDNLLIDEIKSYLINKYSKEKDKRIRLKPNKQDKEFFDKLFNRSEDLDVNSNIINNYHLFYKKISSNELSPKEIFESFKKLLIVLISLHKGIDNPQDIFESLNSTGVDLTAGDLIRNYILMDLEPNEQERLYKEFWIKIEKYTGNVAEFVRNLLIFKEKKSLNKADVYERFKKFSFNEYNNNKENILNDLLEYSKIYSWFVQNNNHKNKEINNNLVRLNKLEFTVCYPYLFDIFNDLKSGQLSEKKIIDILIIIESYAFRKKIVDNTTQGLNKMFITLSKEIKKEDIIKNNYIDILNYILLSKRASQRFPNNEEFKNALIYKEIYLNRKHTNYLLESLETYKEAYPIDIDTLSIEHIMPRNLNNEWKKKLGHNWKEVHEKYLHTLGNLSLTAKNSEMSNSILEEKQEIDYKISKLKLNYKLDKLAEWNENTILDRAERLANKAEKIWPYPKSEYTKLSPEEQRFDLESEDSFSGTKLSYLYIDEDNINIKIKTWRELLIKTCEYLYNYSPTEFIEVEKSEDITLFSKKENKNYVEFVKGHYIFVGHSANRIAVFVKKDVAFF